MASVEYQKYNAPDAKKKSEVPITVEWNNARMIRNHSIRAAVREILNVSKALDVVKVNIIGSPSTGKSTLAETIAHLCHSLGDIPYNVKIFNREELMDLETTISRLQPMNHVLVFDDISFLKSDAGSRQIEKIQKTVTEIRHLPGGQDVKIIIIFNFHYNMAVSKYLRQADFFIWTSIGSSELENTQKIVGATKATTAKIMEFRSIFQQAITNNTFQFKLGVRGKSFTYKFRQPFGPVLFWNTSSLRHVVYPTREWIDPICPICGNARANSIRENMNLDLFDTTMSKRFTPEILKQALRILLFQMGVNTYKPRVKQCMRVIQEYTHHKRINPEQLALHYGLIDKRTRAMFDPELKQELLNDEAPKQSEAT